MRWGLTYEKTMEEEVSLFCADRPLCFNAFHYSEALAYVLEIFFE